MIVEVFVEVAERLELERREAVEKALEAVEKNGFAILRAPTGYGKSFASVPLGLAAYEGSLEGIAKVIHVLPMSSITEDLYKRALQRLLQLRDGEKPLRELEALLFKKYGERWVGYQAWNIDADFKDPLFLASSLIYTTFDSFVLNLFKITPLRAERAPYESARAAIMRSVVVLDEAHLYAEAKMGEGKELTALAAAVDSLKELRIPTLVATATIPLKLARLLDPQAVIVTSVDEGCRYEGERGEVVVKDYKPKGSVEAKLVKGVDPLRELKERSFKKALLVYNTVAEAVEVYDKIRGEFDAVLIHGRLSLGDRRAAMDRLDKAKVVVATQVVEAGVDVKGVDFMITDIAPLPSLVQRLGRVARGGGEGEVLMNISNEVYENAVKVYDKEQLDTTIKLLEKGEVQWRNPCPTHERSYAALLEKYGEALKAEIRGDLKTALGALNRIVTLHRSDAIRYMKAFCGLVRDSVAVPVIVSEQCIREGRGKDCLLMLDAHRIKHEDFAQNGRVKIAVEGDGLEGRCEKAGSAYICEVPDNVLFYKERIGCRKALALDAEVSRVLGARVGVLGLLAKEGAYKPGLGWI